MNRRNFFKAMLAAASAPAIVKADSLMKIWVPPEKKIVTLPSSGTFETVCSWTPEEMPNYYASVIGEMVIDSKGKIYFFKQGEFILYDELENYEVRNEFAIFNQSPPSQSPKGE